MQCNKYKQEKNERDIGKREGNIDDSERNMIGGDRKQGNSYGRIE
jgi:hypothetical protein